MQKLVVLVFTLFTLLEFNPFGPSFTEKYLLEYSGIAQLEMQRTGIPASIKLAQGLLESNWGRSDLATKANNHFGIKCGFGWQGDKFYKVDDDYENGKLVESCFRVYSSPQESYQAHSDFLSKPRASKRYDFLFDYDAMDYRSWANGLQKAGYATDPSYPNKLIGIIEKYKLYQYDQKSDEQIETIKNSTTATEDSNRTTTHPKEDVVKEAIVGTETDVIEPLETRTELINRVPFVRAREGETPLLIARLSGLTYLEISEFNEKLEDPNTPLKQGEIVYIKKKKRKHGNASTTHQVLEGETMYTISQQYGIKLANLYAKNRMPKGTEPFVGEKLNLGAMVKLGKRPKFHTDRKLKSKKKEYLFDDLFSSNE